MQSGAFKDLKAGINGPTEVVRSALQHAAAIGALMIITEATVGDRVERLADADGAGG
jgi:chaperonin GroEL